MSAFATRMLEAKRAKATARNRGQSIGDHRGTMKPRELEFVDNELELQFARIAHSLACIHRDFASDLHWIVLEMNDATIGEIPF
jgi:hypothetical protein